jgi:lipopolysaccharide heptosyltransferase I
VKILILKPTSLGDIVHAIPVLRMLKKHRPLSEIYWWVDASLAQLIEGDPDLSGIILFHRKRWASPACWPEMFASIRAIRKTQFDCVIDLQGLARSGLFAWLASSDLTIGLAGSREGSIAAYDHIAPLPEHSIHAVDRYLEVLAILKTPVRWDFDWLPERSAVASAMKDRLNIGPESHWLVLQPGARWENKRWPVEHFTALADRLVRSSSSIKVAVLGGKEDASLGAAIAAVNPKRCLDLTGELNLQEMIEFIRLSRGMVTNDTGPMHVAAALGKPVVPLFGPTDPARTGPYRQIVRALQNKSVPCVPCMIPRCTNPKPIECLRSITPETVFEAASPFARP